MQVQTLVWLFGDQLYISQSYMVNLRRCLDYLEYPSKRAGDCLFLSFPDFCFVVDISNIVMKGNILTPINKLKSEYI
jgi:hypothetical protein